MMEIRIDHRSLVHRGTFYSLQEKTVESHRATTMDTENNSKKFKKRRRGRGSSDHTATENSSSMKNQEIDTYILL